MKSLENVKKYLKSEVIKYSKDSLLELLSIASILPGNELYQFRFMFLKQLILSIQDDNFQNNITNAEVIESILEYTDSINWESVEDWEPIKNDKSNLFGLNGKIFNFLAGNIEIPENLLERIVVRFFDFEDVIMKINNYSIKLELNKILEYQTEIINLIGKNNFSKSKKFIIPHPEFISEWKKIAEPNFSYNLWENIDNVPEPMSINDAENLFLNNPIINKKIYVPDILILSFVEKINHDLKKSFNDENRQLLRKQLEREVVSSLAEVAPLVAILKDFSIGSVKDKIDFGLVFDNKFFIFMLIEETFDNKILNSRMKNIQEIFKKIETEFIKEKIKINMFGNTQIIDKKLDPIFLIIVDEIENKSIIVENSVKNSTIISYSWIRHILEDIVDNNRSPIYFSKVLEKYNPRTFLSFNFIDFYDFITYDGNYFAIGKDEEKMIIIDPHTSSNIQRKIILEKRPKIDLRPCGYIYPYTFKIIKSRESKKLFYGYNKIINHDFYCYKDSNIEIFILNDRNRFKSYEELDIVNFLYIFITFYFEKLLKENFKLKTDISKIVLEIIPKEWAIKNKIIKNEQDIPLIIGSSQSGFAIFLDPVNFVDFFNKYSKEILEYILENVIQRIVNEEEFILIKEKAKSIYPSKEFKIGNIETVSSENISFINYPTKIDFADNEIELLNHFKGNVTSGIYSGKEAKNIINDVYLFLVKKLNEKIQKYNLENFVNFCYHETEQCIKERKKATLQFRQSQDIKINYDSIKILNEIEEKLQRYNPACRYLLEQSISYKISGKETMNISDWQNICPLAMKIMELANISDFLNYLSDLIDIKIKIELERFILLDIIIDENPIKRSMKNYIDGLKKLDMTKYSPKKRDIDESLEKFHDIFDKGTMKKLDDELEKSFGFRLLDYISVLGTLTYLQDKADRFGIIKVPLSYMIDFVYEKAKNVGFSVDKNIINNVIKFSILYYEGTDGKDIEPWRVNTRKDRLTIKPLVKIDNNIIFAPETLVLAQENVVRQIIDGKWPYQRTLVSPELDKILNIRQKEVSEEFEKSVYGEVKKYSNFSEININNDKCLTNIEEPCPGQIDSISIHLSKKLIILWEAKDIERKYGSREIVCDLEEFVDPEKGYIIKTNAKENYLRLHIKSILDYYNINDKENWKVISCIVLSADSIVKNILETKFNIINFFDIKEFIEDK